MYVLFVSVKPNLPFKPNKSNRSLRKTGFELANSAVVISLADGGSSVAKLGNGRSITGLKLLRDALKEASGVLLAEKEVYFDE